MKSAKTCMSIRPTTIRDNASLEQAYQIMRDNDFRHLPVMDKEGSVVGIISDRDVQRGMRVKKIGPLQQEASFDPDFVVEDFMSWPVYMVLETTPLKIILEEFLTQKVSAFLVENEHGALSGIVTTDDMLKVLLKDESKHDESVIKYLSHHFFDPEIKTSHRSC